MRVYCEHWNVSLIQKCHALAIEYPTYGLYKSKSKLMEESTFEKDAMAVYWECTKLMNLRPQQVIVMGRSLGTGIASLFAQKLSAHNSEPGALFLMSPFLSPATLAREKTYCIFHFITNYMLGNFLNTEERFAQMAIPSLIVHGKRDEVIPVSHSIQLASLRKDGGVEFCQWAHMTHNNFRAEEDIALPFRSFLQKHGLIGNTNLAPIDAQRFIEQYHR